MTRSVVLASVLLGTVLLGSCGSGGKAILLREQDDGRTVDLRVGDTLEVTLEGNPTTGYQWEVSPGGLSVLRQVGEAEFQPDSNLIGAAGLVTLHFEAVASGEERLELIYHRSFEQDVPPLETFEVTVVVR